MATEDTQSRNMCGTIRVTGVAYSDCIQRDLLESAASICFSTVETKKKNQCSDTAFVRFSALDIDGSSLDSAP